ncbi:hypothetical protein [Leifsonia sp. Leaf264]|uniref:hypothetical protein n=1 Tax=Leifsonia sp. Leaf264 TaxID=1736314 RepID=UPI0006FA8AC8|nr:hypothetical protein [Leifsonia sp. Leaf264]KQO98867.1 hypothetical protein ASF30_12455 [Leifsonia sp. Leaf264]
MTNSSTPRTPWISADYAPSGIKFTGAQKLADSGVAPLVAAARGYETLESEQVKDFAKQHRLGNANSKQYNQVATVTQYADALVLLWYSADQVAEAHRRSQPPIFTSMQLRPGSPRRNPATGKLMKYENLKDQPSVIDVNPGTPLEWYSSSPKLLITEGVIKGDAALTAQLRANGIPEEELQNNGLTRVEAIDKLGKLMMSIPEEKRVTILSFVGVANWKNNEVWISMPLRGRQLLLAFDGDIATNYNVWKQANDLWGYTQGKGAIVNLVDLDIVDFDDKVANLIDEENAKSTGANTPVKAEKVGIDDFLVRHGDWDDILARLTMQLPPQPAIKRDDEPVGTWRVAEDGNSVAAYVEKEDPFGNKIAQWVTQGNIGGYIAALETHRAPTEREVETAVFGEGVQEQDVPSSSIVRIHLQWLNEDGDEMTADVTGPSTILADPPSEWHKRKADIPNSLLIHPEWPYTGQTGSSWLKAIKANRDTPLREHVSWSAMGYVPVEGSKVCAFISGKTVIAASESDRLKTIPGVNEVVLPGSAKFSLPVVDPEPGTDEWKELVRTDLNTLRDRFITKGAWTNKQIAAAVIAGGLRPTVPVPNTTVLYAVGAPGGGKSWTVSMILAFWQARKTWSNKMLPGSMKDTGTSVEQALAQTNIWVMDDLAPSADKRQSEMEQSKLGDIVRSVHNKTAKRRSGTELKAREVFEPKALLIATAENEHTVNSVRDRTVILNLDKDALNEHATDMVEFRDHDATPGRITVEAVQAYQTLAVHNGWANTLEHIVRGAAARYEEVARKVITAVTSDGRKIEGKAPDRHIGMAVDLMLGLLSIEVLAEMVGDKEWLKLLDPKKKGNLLELIAQLVSGSFQSQAEVTPGRSLMEAIRLLIASGRAHILNANDPGIPPYPNGTPFMNNQMGWRADSQDKLRPLGTSIGWLVGDDMVMLNATNAFEMAQRAYPHLLPSGTMASVSFNSVWNEGLSHPRYTDRDGNRATKVFRNGGKSQRGVPIHVDLLLNDELPEPEAKPVEVESEFD